MIDYYKILQVLPTAEEEVIEGAYKKLSKKYHPDLNADTDAHEKMKQINEAYSVLKDAQSRRLYNEQLKIKTTVETSSASEAAKGILEGYFHAIQVGNYQKAYDFVTQIDRSKIPYEEFVIWQKAVSNVFQLRRFECQLKADEKEAWIKGVCYPRIFDFVVMTEEHNTIMERIERDFLLKRVVWEGRSFKVHMGFDGVHSLIDRFETLTGLLLAKQSNALKDNSTGLLTASGLIDVLNAESERFSRYSRHFCTVMVQLKGDVLPLRLPLSNILKNQFRKLDHVGIWSEGTWLVVLPETDLNGGIKAAFKLKKQITSQMKEVIHIGIGVESYRGDIQMMMHQLELFAMLSMSKGKCAIASARGVYS